jgi:hypothetical protein
MTAFCHAGPIVHSVRKSALGRDERYSRQCTKDGFGSDLSRLIGVTRMTEIGAFRPE